MSPLVRIFSLIFFLSSQSILAQTQLDDARRTLTSSLRLHEHEISQAVDTLIRGPFDQEDQLLVLREGQNASPRIRMMVFKALPHMKISQQSLDVVKETSCFNPAYHSRLICVAVAGRLSSPESNQLLFEMLEDPDQFVAKAAAQNLTRRNLKAELVKWLSHSPIDWDSSKGLFICGYFQDRLKPETQGTLIGQIQSLTRTSEDSPLLRSVTQFESLCYRRN